MSIPSARPVGVVSKQPRISGTTLWSFTALAFLAVLMDGFDTVALPFSVPTLAQEWGIRPSSFSTSLVVTNLGAVTGYIFAGKVSAWTGPRRLLGVGVLWYGLCSLGVAVTLPMESLGLLSLFRFLTGIGLGAVLPVAISLATSYAPDHLRERIAVLITLGLATGATIGGLAGGSLIEALGAKGVFYIAGGFPVLIAGIIAIHAMPNQLNPDLTPNTKSERRKAESFTQLFSGRLALLTPVLWIFAFVAFLTTYLINSWVPTLLGSYGFDARNAPMGIAMYNMGGIGGTLLLALLSRKIGVARTQVMTSVLGIAALLLLGLSDLGHSLILSVLFVAGLGTITNGNGQMALATSLYPAEARATGIGWNAAIGRSGSIVAPAIGGVLIAAQLGARPILMLTAIPVLIALVCAAFLAFMVRASPDSGDAHAGVRLEPKARA